MRAAIYARYSSDNQHERSIDDQVRLCRDQAARLGAEVIGVYADYALSGAHLKSRPEANRLLADAKAGRFDVVLAEALDRLSRDQEDVAGIHKRLTFCGVRIVTVAEGDISELHVGLKGTMNALFLKDLAIKIRRGQRGRAEAGHSPGGLGYGYKVVRELDARGEPVRGLRAIEDEQAVVVRRIFEEVAAGRPARAVAQGLNRDRIPSPFGGAWGPSTINGNRGRGSGLLWNEAYIGRLVYNRTTFVKDPETGKRLSRPLPPEQWVVNEVPQLRIVSDELWQAAHAVKARQRKFPLHVRRRQRHLFSGMIKCGVCGNGYTAKSGDGRLVCTGHREKGVCDNGRTILVAKLEARVLAGIRDKLLEPDRIAKALKEYHEERRRLRRDAARRSGRDKSRLATVERELQEVMDLVCAGEWRRNKTVMERLDTLEAERVTLRQAVAAASTPDPVIELHPTAIDAYRKMLEQLQAGLREDDAGEFDRTKALMRRLIDRIEVRPQKERGRVEIIAHGRVCELINLVSRPTGTDPETAICMVAEEGLEPPTNGL